MAGLLDIVAESPVLMYSLAVLAVLVPSFLYLFHQPSFPKNAPKQATEQFPIFGAWKFFSDRHYWFERQRDHSSTGNFSYYVGDKPVVGLSGEEGRRLFFDSKAMGFSEAYAALLAGAPPVKSGNIMTSDEHSSQDGFSSYFNKRLIAMVKGPQLAKGLPDLINDVYSQLDKLAADPAHETDPWDSIYRTVYQMTMRTVACVEIAGNDELREETLQLYETVEDAASTMAIMFNWMPLYSKLRRTIAGAKLYMIFKRIIDARAKEGRREDDALQFMLDQGDDITNIITFVLGALFAGQLNSGVNAAWILVYLATNKPIREKVFEEVNAAADKYNPDKSLSLKERLRSVPMEAWEGEFPLIDASLRETIRLAMPGCAFRKNISGKDIPLSTGEVVPKNAFVTYLVADVHQDPDIYPEPMVWDPMRYSPERAEDKKVYHAGLMWGVSRHPCLGMRFAKLENNMIVALFLAYFTDLEVWGSKGRMENPPLPNLNFLTAHRPLQPVKLRYKLRA